MKKDPKTGKVPYFQWLSIILSNIKNVITETYRATRKEYAQRYLVEFQYRINSRFDLIKPFKSFLYKARYFRPLLGKLLKREANNL